MKSTATAIREGLATLVITLPWLNPFAPGPSPAVLPWLVALAATAGLILASLCAISGEAVSGASFERRWAYPAAWAWMLAGVISSSIGLLQYFDVAAALDPWVNPTSLGEAFANLRQRNQFATLTIMALAALLGLVLNRRFSGCRQWLGLYAAWSLWQSLGFSFSASTFGCPNLHFLF